MSTETNTALQEATNQPLDEFDSKHFDNHDLTDEFPISALFPVKKAFPILCVVISIISAFAFGSDYFHSMVQSMRDAVGLKGPVLYYLACTVFAVILGYWYLYSYMFRYGITGGMFTIKKGVLVRSSYDYPITALQNTAIKRDLLDVLFGLCTVQIMTAHEASDDLVAIRGLSNKSGKELRQYLRDLINQFQTSRLDLKALQDELESAKRQIKSARTI